MGNKIGDYIHFHRQNYKNYGTNIKSGSGTVNSYFTGHISALKDSVKTKSSSLSSDEIDKFESIFSSIAQGKNLYNIGSVYGEDYEDIRNSLINDFIKRMNGAIKPNEIGFYGKIDNSQSSNLKSLAQQIQGGYKQYIGEQIDTNQTYQTLELLRNRYKKIINVDFIQAINNTNDNTVKQLVLDLYNSSTSHKIKSLENLCNNPNLKRKCEEAISAIEGKGNLRTKISNTDPALDALYKIYNYFSMPAASLAQGTFAEDIGILANKIMNYSVLLEEASFLKDLASSVKKDLRNKPGSRNAVSIEFDSSNINKILNEELKKIPDQRIVNSNGNIELTFGQQKIDINITSPISGIDEGVSIKSYDLKNANWIHLDSGRPLLTFLLNEGIDFTNHYLNAQAARWDEGGNPNIHTDDNIIATDELVRQSNEALRLAIILTSFKGTLFNGKHKQATMFLMNDVSSGRVKLFDMNTLINSLIDVKGAFSIKIDRDGGEAKLNKNEVSTPIISDKTIGYYNYIKKYQNADSMMLFKENNIGAQKRIANILADIHKAKVYTMVNSRMVSNKM